jgi:hypothetical protein
MQNSNDTLRFIEELPTLRHPRSGLDKKRQIRGEDFGAYVAPVRPVHRLATGAPSVPPKAPIPQATEFSHNLLGASEIPSTFGATTVVVASLFCWFLSHVIFSTNP